MKCEKTTATSPALTLTPPTLMAPHAPHRMGLASHQSNQSPQAPTQALVQPAHHPHPPRPHSLSIHDSAATTAPPSPSGARPARPHLTLGPLDALRSGAPPLAPPAHAAVPPRLHRHAVLAALHVAFSSPLAEAGAAPLHCPWCAAPSAVHPKIGFNCRVLLQAPRPDSQPRSAFVALCCSSSLPHRKRLTM